MKIAIASAFLGHVPRGVESWASDLAAELYKRGADVTLFKGGGLAELPYERHLRCTNHTAPLWGRVTRWTRHGGWRLGLGSPEGLQQTTFALHLIGELRRGQLDIVHTQDSMVGLVLDRARRLQLHRTKVILGNGQDESFEFLLRVEHVQETAPYYLEQHQRRGLSVDHLWFAIPNFVDCKTFCPGDRTTSQKKFDIPPDRFVVLDVAALKMTHKRVDWLMQEVAKLRQTHPEAFLVVAGATTPETPEVERVARQTLDGHVRLLANLKRDQMPDLYRAADVLAHPALQELFGIVFLEAMACGVPAIGNCFAVTEWVIGPGGTTVDMQCPGALAKSLSRYVQDRCLLNDTGVLARRYVQEHFETSRVVDQILGMYQEVLKSS